MLQPTTEEIAITAYLSIIYYIQAAQKRATLIKTGELGRVRTRRRKSRTIYELV